MTNLIVEAEGIAVPLIEHFESCQLFEYLDLADYPTIGWGIRIHHGQYPNGITHDQADEMFYNVLHATILHVVSLLARKSSATPNEVAAMASLAYNIGFGQVHPHVDGFATSTLLRLYNQGKKSEAALQFVRWDKSEGKVIDGLLRRRRCEGLIFGGHTIADLKRLNWLQS